jgi:hypothetical protein
MSELDTLTLALVAAFGIIWFTSRLIKRDWHQHTYRHWIRHGRTMGLFSFYEVYVAHCETCGRPKSKWVKSA